MESHRMEIFVTMISASTGYEELEVSFFESFEYKIMEMLDFL